MGRKKRDLDPGTKSDAWSDKYLLDTGCDKYLVVGSIRWLIEMCGWLRTEVGSSNTHASLKHTHQHARVKTCYSLQYRGLAYSRSLQWTRDCEFTRYCFEAVTDDVSKMRQLIDYPWDPYYYEYWIKSCGGTFGMNRSYHPFRGNPKEYRTPK